MGVVSADVGFIVENFLVPFHHRVRYGVLGAAIATRVGHPAALPGKYANATVTMLNTHFGGRCQQASWVVNENGHPEGYGNQPGPLYDPNWNEHTPLHADVQEFLNWMDATRPEWDEGLLSTCP